MESDAVVGSGVGQRNRRSEVSSREGGDRPVGEARGVSGWKCQGEEGESVVE